MRRYVPVSRDGSLGRPRVRRNLSVFEFFDFDDSRYRCKLAILSSQAASWCCVTQDPSRNIMMPRENTSSQSVPSVYRLCPQLIFMSDVTSRWLSCFQLSRRPWYYMHRL
jgi:hypothetical protein